MGKQRNHMSAVITDKKGLVKFKSIKFFTTQLPEIGKEYMIYFKFDIDNFRNKGDLQLKIENWEPAKSTDESDES
jgi:hypothetical protein